jgi:hypothetical protein
MTTYRYHPGVLAALDRHGLRPRPDSEPGRVYDLLKAIYSFEIRELKHRRHELERHLGPQPLDDYRRGVLALKAKYEVLGLPAHNWAEPLGGDTEG